MTRPRCSFRAWRSTAVDRTRGPARQTWCLRWPFGSGLAAGQDSSILGLLRRPAGPLDHCRCDALGCSLGPSQDRAR